ncbi:hypothetical protein HPB51_025659 [Rhipicephalus microplus]|uniref:Uncharacterized protein n=1 Tax=Rhipicephalus microplus TaxID=6941 RepID=A0A9J6DKB9_RHIMP|nr:hypothetical protein HPB51_025659 [Rhipicephalus microplus]
MRSLRQAASAKPLRTSNYRTITLAVYARYCICLVQGNRCCYIGRLAVVLELRGQQPRGASCRDASRWVPLPRDAMPQACFVSAAAARGDDDSSRHRGGLQPPPTDPFVAATARLSAGMQRESSSFGSSCFSQARECDHARSALSDDYLRVRFKKHTRSRFLVSFCVRVRSFVRAFEN